MKNLFAIVLSFCLLSTQAFAQTSSKESEGFQSPSTLDRFVRGIVTQNRELIGSSVTKDLVVRISVKKPNDELVPLKYVEGKGLDYLMKSFARIKDSRGSHLRARCQGQELDQSLSALHCVFYNVSDNSEHYRVSGMIQGTDEQIPVSGVVFTVTDDKLLGAVDG